jgi:hypothetical protein
LLWTVVGAVGDGLLSATKRRSATF